MLLRPLLYNFLYKLLFCYTSCIAQNFSPLKSTVGEGVTAVHNYQQEPTQVTISAFSFLRFGTFFSGSEGGVITVSENGMRSADGSIVLLGSGTLVSPAVFEIRAPAYAMIHIMTPAQIRLTGPNNAYLTCFPDFGTSSQVMVAPANAPSGFLVPMGGQLHIAPQAILPPGKYSGTIEIVLIIE
jgi:hypothetical protein